MIGYTRIIMRILVKYVAISELREEFGDGIQQFGIFISVFAYIFAYIFSDTVPIP